MSSGETQLFDAYDRSGRRCFMRLQVIMHTEDGRPMYGWPHGGGLDPEDIKSGFYEIVKSGEKPADK